MVLNPARFRHILLILLLLMLMVALPLSASAATTGTITASADHVDEGDYIRLSTNMTGTVTWTSSNSSLATVSSNGLVYGKKAGQVTITASCPGYTDASITLWVAVPDGVYYLKNASSGLCMETVMETAYVYTQSTSSTGRISQLWKISYASNGNYIIRPLGDFSLAMTVGHSGLVTVEKSATAYSGIYWQIVHNAFGYAFKLGGSNANTAMPTVNGPTGVPVHPSDWTSSLTCHWELEEIYGVFLRDTNTQKVLTSSVVKSVELDDAPVTLSDLGLSLEYYGNLTTRLWNSTKSAVTTVNLDGSLNLINGGNTTITLTAALHGNAYTASYDLIVMVPISGYELNYTPELWNYSPVQGKTNCYSYAINNQVHPETQTLLWMNPGITEGYYIAKSEITKDKITDYIELDAENFGFLFESCSSTSTCPVGSYKIALVVDPSTDYHWYRQNSDGTWSHKPGAGAVTLLDASGEIIYDPATADRNYGATLNYTDFVGYYFITPLNNMYSATQAAAASYDTNAYLYVEYQVDKQVLPDSGTAHLVYEGMSYSQVTELLGLPQQQRTFGLLVVEYALADGSFLVVEYVSIDGQLIVNNCFIEASDYVAE